ncbi:NADP-dependent phosphogluconate dehydrogenase [Patescibacteria group bacterium]|nr:NADP-dependent phosphogluconate dehydrogenase [Patescibacteria group bacterium]MBU2259036.1 NADP-dependent phosphogluconate dehydrogenase [Patescibacteria group bacterium]
MTMQLGVIGLGTMGANLARNALRNGAAVSVYNRTEKVTDEFMKEFGAEGEFTACKTYKDLVQSLSPPRAILMMVKAGEVVDQVIEDLLPELESGDVLIDGGNSLYMDTERRLEELNKKSVQLLGLGVSGGEQGALNGPSMMAGGEKAAYEVVESLLIKMAAKIEDLSNVQRPTSDVTEFDVDVGRVTLDKKKSSCVAYLGEGGAGHFVKMVHNGIEYGVMQLIAEAYAILKNIGGFSNAQLSETFAAWNQGDDLQSFLIEITADIFKKKEGKGELIDLIKDAAGQKGTGKWMTQAAHDFGVAIPTINAAVDARILSGSESERKSAKSFPVRVDEQDPVPPPEKLRSIVRHALELSVICTYMQGFNLIKYANEEKGWGMDLSEVARIWRGGCIIRSVQLKRFQNALGSTQSIAKSAKEAILERFKGERQLDWRRAVTFASSRGIAVPALSASLSYFDALRAEKLPQNLIQAQRDFFGAHTFERTDMKGVFHSEWQ